MTKLKLVVSAEFCPAKGEIFILDNIRPVELGYDLGTYINEEPPIRTVICNPANEEWVRQWIKDGSMDFELVEVDHRDD